MRERERERLYKNVHGQSWGKLCQGPQNSGSVPISLSVGSNQDNNSTKGNYSTGIFFWV